MDQKIVLGTVNFTGYAHVIVTPVSNEALVVWEQYIPAPFDQVEYVITGLGPENYWINTYEAATTSELGQRYSKFFISGVGSSNVWEEKIYDMHALPVTASLSNGNADLTDTYLIGKSIFSYFKEAYNFLTDGLDLNFDPATGKIALLNGFTFNPGGGGSNGERFRIVVKYNVATESSSGVGGLYKGTLDVTTPTESLKLEDVDKRICGRGTGYTQEIQLCALAIVNVEHGFYFDNSVGGTAKQIKIKTVGSDKIYFSGFGSGSFLFTEFWVGQGEHLLLRKYTYGGNSYWEVNSDYKGVQVGKPTQAMEKDFPGFMPWDNTLYFSDHYPRLKWYLQNRVPNSRLIVDDAIISSDWERPVLKPGLFAVTSDFSRFRAPDVQNLSRRAIMSVNEYPVDEQRSFDYPGGFQPAMVGPHNHAVDTRSKAGKSDNANDRDVMVPATGVDGIVYSVNNSGVENRVDNYAVIDGCFI